MFQKIISSPVGPLLIKASDKGITHLEFVSKNVKAETKLNVYIEECEKQLTEYFSKKRTNFDLKLDLKGTEFQKKVWQVLTKIKFGKVISYKDQSIKFGSPKSIRAIASANGKNPIPIIIPCHRVVASNKHLHGFSSGLKLKQDLLEHEGLKIQDLKII